jgi:hypothetical protein
MSRKKAACEKAPSQGKSHFCWGKQVVEEGEAVLGWMPILKNPIPDNDPILEKNPILEF